MKITYDLDLNDVVSFLQVAATRDPRLLDQNLNKHEIRNAVTATLRRQGFDAIEGWNDELDDLESGEIAGWAYAQARRFKF